MLVLNRLLRDGAKTFVSICYGCFEKTWKKLMSFGINVVSIFTRGAQLYYVQQIQKSFAFHLECIHCMAHCTNFIVQTFSQIWPYCEIYKRFYFNPFTHFSLTKKKTWHWFFLNGHIWWMQKGTKFCKMSQHARLTLLVQQNGLRSCTCH